MTNARLFVTRSTFSTKVLVEWSEVVWYTWNRSPTWLATDRTHRRSQIRLALWCKSFLTCRWLILFLSLHFNWLWPCQFIINWIMLFVNWWESRRLLWVEAIYELRWCHFRLILIDFVRRLKLFGHFFTRNGVSHVIFTFIRLRLKHSIAFLTERIKAFGVRSIRFEFLLNTSLTFGHFNFKRTAFHCFKAELVLVDPCLNVFLIRLLVTNFASTSIYRSLASRKLTAWHFTLFIKSPLSSSLRLAMNLDYTFVSNTFS